MQETQYTQQTTIRTAPNQDIETPWIYKSPENTQNTHRNMKQTFIKRKTGVPLWIGHRKHPLGPTATKSNFSNELTVCLVSSTFFCKSLHFLFRVSMFRTHTFVLDKETAILNVHDVSLIRNQVFCFQKQMSPECHSVTLWFHHSRIMSEFGR